MEMNVHDLTLGAIEQLLGIRIIINEGGPSIVDPAGLTQFYFAVRGRNNGSWVGISDGEIVASGVQANGKRFEFTPERIVVEDK